MGGGGVFPFYVCFNSSHIQSYSNPSPIPSPRLLSVCLLELFPRPRAWDVRTGGRSATAGGITICLLLIVSCRSLTAFVRFRLACGSGFTLVPRFPRLLGRVLIPAAGTRPIFATCSPVPCVSYGVLAFRPFLIRRVRSDRLVPRFALPRRSPPRSSVCLLTPSRSRGGLALVRSRAVLPRSALRPVLLVVRRGDGCAVVPYRLGRLSGACLVVRACLLRAACLPRLGSCVGGVGISSLRVACLDTQIAPFPLSRSGAIFPVSVVLAYSSMMA